MMVALAAPLSRALPVRAPDTRMSYGALIASMAHLAAATPILRRRAFYQACLFSLSACSGRRRRCCSPDRTID
jgi:hypothetical protein